MLDAEKGLRLGEEVWGDMMNKLGRNLLDPRDNHLFGLSKNYFNDLELKMMTQKEPRPKRPSPFKGNQSGEVKFGTVREPNNVSFSAVDFFIELDIHLNTQGLYATNGGEQGVRVLNERIFFLDYCNHALKLIIEWNDKFYPRNRRRSNRDHRTIIQKAFPDYLLFRIKEKDILVKGSDQFISYILEKIYTR